jgi:hypothetical protein
MSCKLVLLHLSSKSATRGRGRCRASFRGETETSPRPRGGLRGPRQRGGELYFGGVLDRILPLGELLLLGGGVTETLLLRGVGGVEDRRRSRRGGVTEPLRLGGGLRAREGGVSDLLRLGGGLKDSLLLLLLARRRAYLRESPLLESDSVSESLLVVVSLSLSDDDESEGDDARPAAASSARRCCMISAGADWYHISVSTKGTSERETGHGL